jgi:hypothetical protein
METTVDSPSPVWPVDPEHGALRLSVIGVLLGSCVVGFLVFNSLIPGEEINFIAAILGFIVAVAITWQFERYMKRRWPSGRTVAIEGDKIRFRSKDVVQQEIDASRHVNAMLWRFKIRRGSRLKGWFVVACALEQDSNYLAVYTFMPPEQVNTPAIASRYKMLLPNKEADKDLRLAGEQRRLRSAEEHRWIHGAEMNRQDFENLVGRLQRQFPKWMPAN